MTALGIRYLTGNSVATNLASPRKAEFPPHFGRVFMAMAAAHFDTGGDEKERAALEWLECAGPPEIEAEQARERSFTETYVPVNDKVTGVASRTRQPRSFPTSNLPNPFVYLLWNSDVPHELKQPLEALCAKVTRIGHSSSLAQMWVAEDAAAIQPDWRPSTGQSDIHMRVAEPGTLNYLESQFNTGAIRRYESIAQQLASAKGKQKIRFKQEIAESFPAGVPVSRRPRLTTWQGYRQVKQIRTDPAITPGPFHPSFLVFRAREEQAILGLSATQQLTSALRNAAMKSAGDDVPEWLSGHQPDGRPSVQPHAAFFPLPFVGREYADGHVMGMAIALPREVEADPAQQDSLRRVIGSFLFRDPAEEPGERDGQNRIVDLWRRNSQGEYSWHWRGEREGRARPPETLRNATWAGPSNVWATVTPGVLHHYPRRGRDGEIERILSEAFASAGYPQPETLSVLPVSVFQGAGHARSMPDFAEGGPELCKYQTHFVARFSQALEGPVLIGRGRFRGYGLMRPWKGRHD